MVTIFAFTDPHGKTRTAEAVVQALDGHEVDGVVASGDLTYFEKIEPGFGDTLSKLNRPIYAIPGNHEADERMYDLRKFHPFWVDVSYKVADAGKFLVAGIPGSNEWWPDLKCDMDLARHMAAILKPARRDKPFVILVHIPPSGCGIDGTKKRTADGGGNATAREVIRILKPDLVVTGHYHQHFGEQGEVDGIPVYNPGPTGSFIQVPISSKQRKLA